VNRPRRWVTIIVHTDDNPRSHTYRLPLSLVRGAAIGAAVIAGIILLAAVSYAPVASTAARVPGLRRQVAALRAENEQVRLLASRLEEIESRYEQVRAMLGADIVPPHPEEHGGLQVVRPVVARPPDAAPRYPPGPTLPIYWPLDEPGIVTRGPMGTGAGSEAHPGLDIAVRSGTPIRAAGGGVVAEAGVDPDYGRYVLINHPQGYQSMYGHASRVLVTAGEAVQAGQVIGLSGSTGRSTAPHLHFEIRRNGQQIDPRSLISEPRL
jgi:murein DD-endopeptidase MepM/ murein hydrolase activator NlpD